MKAVALAFALVLLLSPLAAAEKDDGKGKERSDDAREHANAAFDHHGSKWIFHNDQIAVWFHEGEKKARPDIRVAINGTDGNKSGYRVEILRLCEVALDDVRCDEDLPHVNLARAKDWNVVTEQGADSLTLTMVRAEAQALVTLVWHVNTTSATVKFDLKVDNWRWSNDSDHLLLDMHVMGHDLRNSTGARIDIGDAGYVKWAPTASSEKGTLNVTAITKAQKERGDDDEGDDDDHEKAERHSDKGGHLWLLFNGTGGYRSLTYDPEFGVASSSTSAAAVPMPGVIAAVAVLAGAAIVLRRKRA